MSAKTMKITDLAKRLIQIADVLRTIPDAADVNVASHGSEPISVFGVQSLRVMMSVSSLHPDTLSLHLVGDGIELHAESDGVTPPLVVGDSNSYRTGDFWQTLHQQCLVRRSATTK